MATVNSIGSNIPIEITKGGTQVSSNIANGVIVGGTTSTAPLQNVGAGSLGDFLLSGGSASVPTWGTGGGGTASLILLQTQSITVLTNEVDFTTGFSTSYVKYLLTVNNYWPGSSGTNLLLQVSSDGGSTWFSTTYDSGSNLYTYNTSTLTNYNTTTGFLVFPPSAIVGGGAGASAQIWFNNVEGPINPDASSFTGISVAVDTGLSDTAGGTMAGFAPSTTYITAMRFIPSSGQINAGTFSLYALAQ